MKKLPIYKDKPNLDYILTADVFHTPTHIIAGVTGTNKPLLILKQEPHNIGGNSYKIMILHKDHTGVSRISFTSLRDTCEYILDTLKGSLYKFENQIDCLKYLQQVYKINP